MNDNLIYNQTFISATIDAVNATIEPRGVITAPISYTVTNTQPFVQNLNELTSLFVLRWFLTVKTAKV